MGEALDNLVGQNFEDRYLIEEVLGENEVSRLYRAQQLSMQRSVALRISHDAISEDPEKAARFERAAEAIGAIQHPNIINLIDFGTSADGRIYLVREFVKGQRLYHLMSGDRRMEKRRVLHILLQVLDALAEAHALGIVHRDLNPRSVFVDQVGASNDFVKLFDFRIGIPTSAQREALVSQDPHYMAPEQIRGEGVTPKTDLYALGILGYHLLTGHPPFLGHSRPDIVAGHIERLPTPLSVQGEHLTCPLSDLVMQCLHKSPDERPNDAKSMLAYLQTPRHKEAILDTDTHDTLPDLPPASAPAADPPDITPPSDPLGPPDIAFADDLDVPLDADCALDDDLASPASDAPASGSKALTLFILVVLAAALIGAFLLTQRRPTDELMPPTPNPSAPQTLPDTTNVAPPITLDVTTDTPTPADLTLDSGPSQEAGATDADAPSPDLAPAKRFVTLRTRPPGALVFNGATRLGTTPLEVLLPKGQDRQLLRIKLRGYRMASVTLLASEAGTSHQVRLKKKRGKRPSTTPSQTPGAGSLEELMNR